MPKALFYAGTAFCLFLALASAAQSAHQWEGSALAFVALSGMRIGAQAPASWAVIVALLAGLGAAAMFVRMAALLAARNLFGAFLSIVCVAAAVTSLAWLLLLQTRMLILVRHGATTLGLNDLHFAAAMMLGCFVSLSFLSLRPYFRIQASRVLSALVFFPLPLFLLILAQELFVAGSAAPLPAASPASQVFFAVVGMLFFAIGVHCIRHRYMFLEMTNLRELLDGRADPSARATRRPIGGVAYDG